MGLTAMRSGHELNGPSSIVNGWSWERIRAEREPDRDRDFGPSR